MCTPAFVVDGNTHVLAAFRGAGGCMAHMTDTAASAKLQTATAFGPTQVGMPKKFVNYLQINALDPSQTRKAVPQVTQGIFRSLMRLQKCGRHVARRGSHAQRQMQSDTETAVWAPRVF